MCTAGRIKHHLKHNLWKPGASIVFVGYQAKGTTGRKIIDGVKQVKIFRENISVKAKVFTIGGFSAHADQRDLLEWVSNFESKPRVFIVHGEPSASDALAQKLREQFGLLVHIPQWMERLILKPKEVSIEETPQETSPDLKTDTLNAIVDLERQLEALRRRIKDGKTSESIEEEDLDRLKYIKEELESIVS